MTAHVSEDAKKPSLLRQVWNAHLDKPIKKKSICTKLYKRALTGQETQR